MHSAIDGLLNRAESAEYLRTSVSAIKYWTQVGKLAHFRIGRHFFYRKEDLNDMVRYVKADPLQKKKKRTRPIPTL